MNMNGRPVPGMALAGSRSKAESPSLSDNEPLYQLIIFRDPLLLAYLAFC